MAIHLKYEVSKDISEKALEAIEIARKSGKIKKGINEVTKALERGSAKLVIIANDTQPEEIIMHIPILCEEKNVPCITVSSRQELGTAAGLKVPCTSIAITEDGESKELLKEISQKTIGIKIGERK